MLLRLPWLLSRKRLIIAMLVDGILFALFKHQAHWTSASLVPWAFLLFWCLGSYVTGRYHTMKSRSLELVTDQMIRTIAVLCLSLFVYLGYHWTYEITLNNQGQREFLAPLFINFAAISLVLQFLLFTTVRRRKPLIQNWWYLGSETQYLELQRHLQWSRLKCRLQHKSIDALDIESTCENIDGIVIAIDNFKDHAALEHLMKLRNQGLLVLSLFGWCEHVLQRFPPDILDDADLLRAEFYIPDGSVQSRIKRLGDVAVSALLLVLTSPLIILCAIGIKATDSGPIFYSQIRSGFNGKPFRIWKLRTMRINAEMDGPKWAEVRDRRITPIGRLLRITRIDELPQLTTVLLGEMSLIGPRPERPEFEEVLKQQITHYSLRHLMQPGLSGWAQVNYPYGASIEDAANKLSYDLYYLRNYSFALDLLILFKTIRLVFNAQGAIAIESKSSS
jgi:exopolysaccharide biosynthesis polyprenyl glycosylphosphotransferase